MGSNLSRREFLAGLSALAAELRQEIEAKVDGFDPDPKAQERRKAEAERSLAFFARTYFPHYCSAAPSVMHEWLFDRLGRLTRAKAGAKLALAAPRGEAKSTLVTQIFALWCVVQGRRHYIPIIMDAFDQAATMLEAIKVELEANPRLRLDFPKACGEGRVWQAGVIVTANNIKIQAFGSGKRMRGLRHGPHRPDLVVCDDLENDENVRSPEQRDKLEAWLKKTVLRLGPADDSLDVIVIGTILHYDSVLSRLLKNPLWESRKFQAVIQWPNRMDLWDRWEEVFRNEGAPAAEAFHAAHRKDLEEGALVSWPAMRPLRKLMEIRARDGHSSFDSELQNDPLSFEDAPFAKVTYWVEELPRWIFFGACDPSLGRLGNRRDPSAILVGGFDRSTGILDVVEAQIAKRLPDRIIEDVIAAQTRWKCQAWAFESVQFQEFLRTELVKRSAQRGIPVPALPVIPHTDKDLRIEALQPHVVNGLIRFHPSQTTLLQQLRHWPKADHDDGPDALEMLWKLAVARARGYAYEPVRRHGETSFRAEMRKLKGIW
jgi:predicted phage terminase large subunit-like protein